MFNSVKLFTLFVALCLLSACGGKNDSVSPNSAPSYDEMWRPKSSLSRAQAQVAANLVATSLGAKIYSVEETHSMEPIIWGNCFIIAEKVKIDDIKVGDIILYRRGGKIILHTCAGNHGGRLTMKGYNNFAGDNQANFFITGDEVVGRYIGHIVFDPNRP